MQLYYSAYLGKLRDNLWILKENSKKNSELSFHGLH